MTVRVAGRAVPMDPRIAWQSVKTEALSLPRALWAWLSLLGLLLLVGAVAAFRSLFPGDKALGTTPTFEWGLLIVGYVFFAITTSGLCLASSLGTVFGIDRFRPLEKRHAILAVLCLVTAFGIIALDLHYPIRLVFGAALNPSPTSPMWWMGVTYGFYLCVLLTEVWSMFTDHPRIHQAACTVAACIAIVAPSTLGAVFGVLAARPFWYGPFTPILMVATAFLSGTALLGVVFFFVGRFALAGAERARALAIPSLRFLLAVALVVVSVLVARQVAAGLLGDEPGVRAATEAELVGPLAPAFLGVRVVGGLVLPLLILTLPRTRTAAGLFAASGLAIVGVFADRFAFVSAGQIAPTTAISGVVSAPYAAYSPSPVEIGILLGAVAFVATIYTLAERYVDLRESDVHAGLSLAAILPRGLAIGLPHRAKRSGPTEAAAQPPATSMAVAVMEEAESSPAEDADVPIADGDDDAPAAGAEADYSEQDAPTDGAGPVRDLETTDGDQGVGPSEPAPPPDAPGAAPDAPAEPAEPDAPAGSAPADDEGRVAEPAATGAER